MWADEWAASCVMQNSQSCDLSPYWDLINFGVLAHMAQAPTQ